MVRVQPAVIGQRRTEEGAYVKAERAVFSHALFAPQVEMAFTPPSPKTNHKVPLVSS